MRTMRRRRLEHGVRGPPAKRGDDRLAPFATFSGGAPHRAIARKCRITASGGRPLNGARGGSHQILGDLHSVQGRALAQLITRDEQL